MPHTVFLDLGDVNYSALPNVIHNNKPDFKIKYSTKISS